MTKIPRIIKRLILAILIFGAVFGALYLYADKIIYNNFLYISSNKLKALVYTSWIYLSVLILYLIDRRKKIRYKSRNYMDMLVYIILPLVAVVVVGKCFYEALNPMEQNYNKIDYYKYVLMAMIISFLIIIPIDIIIKNSKKKSKELVMQTEQEMYKRQIDDARKYIEEIATIKHNMKNQILCMSELLADGNIDEAQKLCKNIESELNKTSYVFNTDNLYLNSILNVLYKKATENHIDIKVVVKSSFKKINGSDLISLLGNLGDNSIEALKTISPQNRNLQIAMSEKGAYYILTFMNCIEKSVLENNHQLSSSKPDKLYHGYGIKTVRNIAEKYDGIVNISEEDKIFKVSVMLKIPSITK